MERQKEETLSPLSPIIKWRIIDQVVLTSFGTTAYGSTKPPEDFGITKWEGVDSNGNVFYLYTKEKPDVVTIDDNPNNLWPKIKNQMERFVKLDPDRAREIKFKFRRNKFEDPEVKEYREYLQQELWKDQFNKRKAEILKEGRNSLRSYQ